jgi:ABC-type Zn uptake system ZnuABC Zn-binding protein ZnuA
MKRLIIFMLILLFALVLTSCATSRKSQSELKGLMLLDNLQLVRNKAFYSRHNIKTKNEAYRKYKKNSRYL